MSRKPQMPCNPLCGRCLRHCKQLVSVLLLDCPRFQPYPFKIVRHRFEQLDLFADEAQRNPDAADSTEKE